MSSGVAVPWAEAYAMGPDLAKELRPHLVRLKAAGSLRRKIPLVGDIEFVAEPRMVPGDLFGNEVPDLAPLLHTLEELGTIEKQGERMIQVTDVYGREGLKLDLFLVHPPAQWGSILAIRTGPWQLGRLAVTRIKARGNRHEGGRIIDGKTGETIPSPTEEDFFAAADLPCVAPNQRDDLWKQFENTTLTGNTMKEGSHA